MTTLPLQSRLEVVGTRGRIVADFVTLSVVVQRHVALPGIITRFTSNLSVSRQLVGSSLSTALGVVTGRVRSYMGMRGLIVKFYESLRQGVAPPVPVEAGMLTVRQMA